MSIRHQILSISLLLASSTIANAGPILNAGWTEDVINAVGTPSGASPYVYDLTSPAIFRITDQFVVGDVYTVSDNGSLILTTVFNGAQPSVFPIGDPLGDAGWTSSVYSHGEVILGDGLHSLVVEGNGVGGLPSHFFARIDAIPEPSSVVLLGLGLVGAIGHAWRQKKRAAV